MIISDDYRRLTYYLDLPERFRAGDFGLYEDEAAILREFIDSFYASAEERGYVSIEDFTEFMDFLALLQDADSEEVENIEATAFIKSTKLRNKFCPEGVDHLMMVGNDELLKIAMEQSAEDIGCRASDFLEDKNVLVPYQPGPGVKKYYKQPIGANLISYGRNIVAAASGELAGIIGEYIDRFTFYHCFETPNLHWLNERLAEKGQAVCFMAEYYLPDTKRLDYHSCPYELRVLERDAFAAYYLPEWSNALCGDRKELDVLAVGAYDGDRLAGLAGCSADAEEMRQIGVDVLPEYRRKGIATALTSKLALEILKRNRIPFYCSAWSNVASARNAIKSGFVPAWVEMTVKPMSAVSRMNEDPSFLPAAEPGGRDGGRESVH